jgi:aminopeptidase-like protein
VSSPDEEKAFLWLLNLSDGTSSLLDVADRSGIAYPVVRRAAERLEQAALLGAK